MTKWFRFLIPILCIALLVGSLTAAYAEMSELSVYFAGIQKRADGTEESVRLDGQFFVSQNGISLGVVCAGDDSILLSGNGDVTLRPVLSTMPEGWVIPEEGVTCKVRTGGLNTVLFQVYAAETTGTGNNSIIEVKVETNVSGQTEQETEIGITELIPTVTPFPGDEQISVAATGDIRMFERPVADTPTPVPSPTPVPVTPAPLGETDGGTLTVHVFNDANNNGDEAANEQPVAGIPVAALDAGGNTAAYALTDAEGNAVMAGLASGKYTIRVEAPYEWGFTKRGNSNIMEPGVETVAESKPVQVNAGESTLCSVGIWKLLHVSGFCWLETDPDGIRKDGEEMLGGVRIKLTGLKNGLTYETTSAADGTWYIPQVKPGFYDMTVYVPEGMAFARYSRYGGDNRSIFTLDGRASMTKQLDMNNGKSVENQNLGFMMATGVTGECFLDANYNGIRDEGEEPLQGVKVQAIKMLSGDTVAEAISDENGQYTLDHMRTGNYAIRCVLPEKDGIAFTRVNMDEGGNRFRPRSGFRETTIENQLIADSQVVTINVGAIYFASVTGVAYIDKDFSGDRNGKEAVVSGLTVKLLDADGNLVATDKTNVKGVFLFEKLTPGTYSIELAAKEGYAFTRLGEGNVIINTYGGNGHSEPFTLAIGEKKTGMDAGMIIPGKIEGTVFADANDNGLWDADENGMEGMQINVLENGETVYRTMVNRDGSFLFDSVMPGEYRLQYVLPENGIFAQVVKNGNTVSGEDSAVSEVFSIGSAGQYKAPLCGALTLGTVSGSVFRDINGNGRMDAGEAYTGDVRITLIPGREDLETMELTTGSDGRFSLEALHPDLYTLRITFPEGSVMSRTDDLLLPVHPGTSGTDNPLQISMGETITEQLLGCVIPASLQGRMWLDENNNGLFDEGEKTPANQKITVIDDKTGSVFAELYTDENGSFGTDGMIPGSFSVRYETDETCRGAEAGDSTFSVENNLLVMNAIELTESENRNDLLLGIVRYTSIGGLVWQDRQGELVPLENAAVTLLGDNGAEVQTVITGEDGEYRFTGLMPGNYSLKTVLPEGCLVVYPDDARLQGDVSSVMTLCSGREGSGEPFELKMAEDRLELNIGSVVPGTIGDFCWLDENGNGLQDGDEQGIPGVRIELMQGDSVILETVSNEYGFYRFPEVYPAQYSLRVTPPAEVKPTVKLNSIPVLVSSLEETDGNTCYTEAIQVVSNRKNYNVDLGFVLRRNGVYPQGYGQGTTQKWK